MTKEKTLEERVAALVPELRARAEEDQDVRWAKAADAFDTILADPLFNRGK